MQPLLLPVRKTLCGPLSRYRIARLGVVYAVLFTGGFALAQWAHQVFWQVFGLGLMWPGGGFWAYADFSCLAGVVHAGMALVSVGIFAASLLVWFACGNVLAPPMVWLLGAIAAASMGHHQGNPAMHWILAEMVLVIFAGAGLLAVWQGYRGRRLRQQANHYLAAQACSLVRPFPLPSADKSAELSLPDLKLMRFVLDRALQPVQDFEGFEWIDQFQTAAVRYQLNFMGYALSMAQANQLAALGAYLDDAQQRLIEKQKDHRIWRYWALENLWGNLRCNPDPTAHENIMYTGFCATQMALFQAASGRRDYDQAGSMTLKHPAGAVYRQDFPTLIDALEREYHKSPYYLIACEPNWVYPLCNTIGAVAIRAGDSQSGQVRWARHEAEFRSQLESEFISLDGRFIPCRSRYSGLALPTLGGVMPQAMTCFFLNTSLPDMAQRQWLLLRRTLLDGRGQLRLAGFWPIDTGNYHFVRAAALAGTALAAREMGDQEVAQQCLAQLDARHPWHDERGRNEACYRPGVSVWAHAVELMARSASQDGFRDLVENPRTRGLQPYIRQIHYPDVLVARAVSDAAHLSAVLYPGGDTGLQAIHLGGLRPGERYQCHASVEGQIRADLQGNASLQVPLAGRTELLVYHSI